MKGRLFSCYLNTLFRLIIPVVLLLNCQYFNAQTSQIDTVGIIEKLVEKKDTMVLLSPQSLLSNKWTLLQEQHIDSLLFRQNSTRFKKELYNLLIKSGSYNPEKQKYPTINSNMASMDGKIIRRIEFETVDIFASSVEDTVYKSSTRFEKLVKNLHYETRRKILKRYLLLNTGDPLDAILAADNERILRDLSFIMDARFIARQIPGNPDSVDLLLLTQDKLPVGLKADMEKSTLAVLGITHYNILGLGHQFEATAYWNAENIPHIGYAFSYGISNLAATFATAKIDYINKWNQESYIVDISRDFRTFFFRNAGGILFENTSKLTNVELFDTTLHDVSLKYTNTDFWAGRLLQLNNHSTRMSSGVFLTGRLNRYENNGGSITSDDYYNAFQTRTMMLFSTGFARQGFRKDNLIHSFGVTEDVPFGYLFDITSGIEWRQSKTRSYFSAGAAYGNYFRNIGYLFAQVKFGTFINNALTEQGAFRFQMRYFSKLYHHNQFQYRNFANFTYLHGINRLAGEYTGVENNAGITGLTSQSMRGKDKIVLNLESVLFSPFILLGFRFAFFGSLDLGLVAPDNLKIIDSRLFSGISAGIRIRNDQLVFNTFMIKFGFYPGKPEDGIAQYLILDSMPRTRFDHFFPTKPIIVDYQ